MNAKKDDNERVFAKKVNDSKSRSIAEALHDLLKEIGISKFDEKNMALPIDLHSLGSANPASEPSSRQHSAAHDRVVKHTGNRRDGGGEPNLFTGTVVLPSTDKPADMHTAALNHSRQAMMLRLEHLFDEVESKVLELIPHDAPILRLLAGPKEEIVETKVRLPTKPVVIGDALPVPQLCPDAVEQLLEASLAHHNLGSFEESLKFLEAARIQLGDIERRVRDKEKAHTSTLSTLNTALTAEEEEENKVMYSDLDMYITVCKGNVYQSCGDDEQSLLHYMEGWTAAKKYEDRDWEIICLNSIGMLAYYNLRYDVALLCFHGVVRYRQEVSGSAASKT